MLRGKAEFALGQFKNAAALFKQAKDMLPSVDASIRSELERQCTVWNNKSQLELSSTRSMGDINAGAYLNTSAPQNPAMFTPNEPAAASSAPPRIEESKTSVEGPAQINLTYDWYQNAQHVFVSYKIKRGGDALKSNLKVSFTETTVVLENSGNDDEVLVHLDLAEKINPEASSYTCTDKRIDLKLKKESETDWRLLEGTGKPATGGAATSAPVTVKRGFQPAYPSSSKKKKNWDQLDKELEKELEADKPEGGDALNSLMKKVYGQMDEDTKRAMVKSYQTSGGTVLSTNWAEVKDKDYDGKDRPSAPDGQEWRDKRTDHYQ